MTAFLNLPDIIIAVLMIILMVIGYRKGLVHTAVKLLSLAASVVLAWMLWPIVADLLEGFGLKAYLAEIAADRLSHSLAGMTSSATHLPLALQDMLLSGQQSVGEGLSDMAASGATNIIAFIIVLIVTRLTIAIAAKLLNLFSKLPVINFFNRAAGTALGAFEGIAIIFIVLAVIYSTVPVGSGNKTEAAIKDSVIARQMYENNPVIDILNLKSADSGNNGE